MSYIEEAIKEAQKINPTLFNSQSNLFLDPAFWQALGKAKLWIVGHFDGKPSWLEYWYRFIDHLADGKDAESFFAELLTPKT